MTTWKTTESEDTLFTCICGETQTQLTITDWDGIYFLTITDYPVGFWRTLWKSIRNKGGHFKEIALSKEDLNNLLKLI